MKSSLLSLSLLLLYVFKEATHSNAASVAEEEQRKIKALKINKKKHTIEIFVLVDNLSYQKWFKLCGEDKAKTVSTIESYFGHVIKESKRIYEQINLNGIWITLALVGYHIEDTPGRLKFMRKAEIGNGYIDDVSAGELFYQWVVKDRNSSRPFLPKFDIAVLFTGYNMNTGDGYGYFGAVCTERGLSIVRDTNFMFTTHTTIHEIGHNLGIHHDGQIGCSDDASYIMSATKLAQNDQNYFKFSSCSLSALHKHLYELGMNTKNHCLLNSPSKESKKNIKKLKMYPGLEFSHDVQCQVLYGQHSYLCPDKQRYGDKMCAQAYCFDPSKTQCYGLTLADGSSCDNKMWCIRKKCVSDKNAPTLDVNCRFGDYGGVIETHKGSMKCPDIARYPELCKMEFYNSLYCCKSCKSSIGKKPPKKTDCKDSQSWCPDYTRTYPTVCSDNEIKQVCCLSCQ